MREVKLFFALCWIALLMKENYFKERAILLAHKVEIRPNQEQEEYLLGAVGSRRFAYNHLVAYYNEHKKLTKTISTNLIKELRSKYEWLEDFSTRVIRNCVDDIDKAIKRAWNTQTVVERNRAIAKALTPKQKIKAFRLGMPQFAKKGINESFSIREKEKITIKDRKFKIEKMPFFIKMRNKIRFSGVVKQVTISMQGGRWFASFLIETTDKYEEKQKPSLDSVGVDVGIKELATLSNGVVFPKSQPLKRQLKKLRQLQKKLSRQIRYSNGYEITKAKIAKLHYFVNQKRKATIHELTNYLVSNFNRVAIEDLNVKGMIKNRKLAKAISDVGFGMFREILAYKCKLYGVKLVLVDRFFPSSKTCSRCGTIKDNLKLSDRVYNCNSCNLVIDRDLNASLNINGWRQV
ncbi:Mobile element protein [hydrothermal vent metagenome]|uniref:Mobile element protein n=1 Tax=hydrothermal vent metagenome TaxID=652676 RepID=A0A1W1C6B9_9ZZZZ